MMARRADEAAERLLEAAREAFDRGELATAARAARKALRHASGASPELRARLRGEALLTLGWILTEQYEDDEALACFAGAREAGFEPGEAQYGEACLRLDRWELDEAEHLLRTGDFPEQRRGAVRYQQAILAELRGRNDEAESLYAEAERLDPQGCPRPVRMSAEEVHALLEEVLASLPAEVQAALDNVVIEIAEIPDPGLTISREHDPQVLGFYRGVPLPEKTLSEGAVLPDRIQIFKRNIERLAADRRELTEELRTTLFHEIGHHLGWDEEDLEARGLG
ncbi:MAG: metallopeptidase family protein [Planctomycetota bacterium]